MDHRPVKNRLNRAAVTGKRVSQRGSTAIEFALVMICAVPLFFGTVAMGITIAAAQEATQVTRDVGHMYGYGADFTSAASQQLVTTLATGFDLTSSGSSVLIFSQITTVFQADCTNASVSPCTNLGSPVFIQRVVIGNTSLKTSAFGTPPSGYLNSLGNISAANYMTQTSLVATGFSSLITQADGDVANVVEGYYTMPNINFLAPGFLGGSSTSTGGFYARSIF
jgi:Flp pilus assembly protein TadG